MLASAGDSGLCAFWHLSGDDVIPAAAGFRRDGPKPVPVLRLRRLHADVATPVKEMTLQLRGPGGHGEQVFSVDPGPARYDAELGLSDASGGWVMLARANAIDHGARVDVRLEQRAHPAASPQVQPETPPFAGTATAVQTLPAAHPPRLASAPLPAVDAVETAPGIRAVDILAKNRAMSVLKAPRVVADADAMRQYESPSFASDSGAPRWTDAVSAIPREGMTAPEAPVPITSPRPPPAREERGAKALCERTPSPVAGGGWGGEEERVSPEPAPRAEPNGTRSPTAPMRYGQPSPGGAELIEAELRVNGCAAPGAMIDLFGKPYRVGPGGRFQLVIRVDDPELIQRAFELNPPDLPDRPGDA
ncbi:MULTISPECIES: hypothetical protein [unclassified Thiocapsa]|uniref:hypothetical protein n=1 Tax=unclassified Thiocapsa TaxID=2641286 RepID=UPI0035AF837D